MMYDLSRITNLKPVGNIEICYKICKDNHPCKGWVYLLDDLQCVLFNYDENYTVQVNDVCTRWGCTKKTVTRQHPWNLGMFNYRYPTDYAGKKLFPITSISNKRIAGPRQCPGRW